MADELLKDLPRDLPFLYDEAAARVRVANNAYLGEGVGAYRPDEASGGR